MNYSGQMYSYENQHFWASQDAARSCGNLEDKIKNKL